MTDTGPTYTAEEVLAAIKLALEARDMPAVAALLERLAPLDPDAAETILAAFRLRQRLDAGR